MLLKSELSIKDNKMYITNNAPGKGYAATTYIIKNDTVKLSPFTPVAWLVPLLFILFGVAISGITIWHYIEYAEFYNEAISITKIIIVIVIGLVFIIIGLAIRQFSEHIGKEAYRHIKDEDYLWLTDHYRVNADLLIE